MSTPGTAAPESTRRVEYDLLVKGGHLLDPSRGISERGDIALRGGKIVAVGGSIDLSGAGAVLNADDLIVAPGLIDLHAHVYWGATEWGLDADDLCRRTGVTTVVDAGSAGASTLPGFLRYVVNGWSTRVLCLLHISRIGLPWKEELAHVGFADAELCVAAARTAPETVIGVKLRASVDAVAENGEQVLREARKAADELHLPLMVHISHAPPELSQILGVLESGDIITHAFTGRRNRLLDERDVLRPDVRSAIERGVLLDIGHGMGSFSFTTAERLLALGVPPWTISTDLHSFCIDGPVHDLPTTMSKLLHLGMTLDQVVAATTSRPAAAIGRGGDLGSLSVDGVGDLALLHLQPGEFELVDGVGERRTASERIRAVATVRAGQVVFDARQEGGSS